MRNELRGLFLIITLLSGSFVLRGQVIEVPLSKKHQSQATFRTQHTLNTLSLPFWDDFSNSNLVPDSTKWLVGANVNINRGRGLNPPSINVATFDGTDQFGVPYSENNDSGPADSLISQPIDLSNIQVSLRNTLYLSFFWQKKGNSDIPENVDSLRLQFKDQSGVWSTLWSVEGGDTMYIDTFKQEIIQVPPGEFQHAAFQFRFQSFGKLTGGYDNWHIDYVLLRTRRDQNDFYLRDRTLSTYPTSVFQDFTAIPFEHYCGRAENFRDSTSVVGFSLEPPVGFPSSIRFGAQIFDATNGSLIDEMNNTADDGLLFNGQTFTTIQASAIDTTALNNAKTDTSLVILTKFFIRTKDSLMFDFIDPISGDSVFFDVDLTVNDTATSLVTLHRHYAYDDGSAETAAGVNTASGQLAYLYVLPVRDTLTDIQIYFPNTESNQADENLRLKIWSRLSNQETVTHTQTIFINASDTLNKFTNYPLSKALLVGDSLFIGIQQTGQVPIFIGMDKSFDSGNQIYFNTSGVWEQNSKVQGSLMLRPVFGNTSDIITAIDEPVLDKHITLYPNPSSTPRVKIEGASETIAKVTVYDLAGREIPSRFEKSQKVIEFSAVTRGIYIIRLTTPDKVQVKRLIFK